MYFSICKSTHVTRKHETARPALLSQLVVTEKGNVIGGTRKVEWIFLPKLMTWYTVSSKKTSFSVPEKDPTTLQSTVSSGTAPSRLSVHAASPWLMLDEGSLYTWCVLHQSVGETTLAPWKTHTTFHGPWKQGAAKADCLSWPDLTHLFSHRK